MFKAIGNVILLYAITQMMGTTFTAFEHALTAAFQTVEVAADVSKAQLFEASKY